MTGNRRVFDEAMRSGANAAWDEDWVQAAASYQQALSEYPKDVSALTSLGLAYSELGRFRDSLDVYAEAIKLLPGDAVLLERIGRMHEQLGHGAEASEAYLASADVHSRQSQGARLALERWQDAKRAFPDGQKAHVYLLQYYQRLGQIDEAVEECLALARILRNHGQPDRASEVCRHALKLMPHNPRVQALLDDIVYGKPVVAALPVPQVPEEPLGELVPEEEVAEGIDSGMGAQGIIETHTRRALVKLAEGVFREGSSRLSNVSTDVEPDLLIGRAIDFHTRGETDQAIRAYEQVLAGGVSEAAVHFNLGSLYQESLRYGDAAVQFELAVRDADFILGSHFALGECCRADGRLDDALVHFLEVLRSLDLLTVGPDRADELVQLYEGFTNNGLASSDTDSALEFASALVEFLSGDDWKEKVFQSRERLDALSADGPLLSLAEMLLVAESERIFCSVERSAEYVRQGLYYTAVEECYHAMRYASTYIPIHLQLVKVLAEMGNVEGATTKLIAIADSYRAKRIYNQAIAVYGQALSLAPMDTVVRAKLIDLYTSHGQIDLALDHYLVLAESYFHRAQMDQAKDVYQEALRLAPRGNSERRWEVEILHRIADIDMQRIDWKRAATVYERIRRLAPDDERAHMALMELYDRFNRTDLAVSEIDALTAIYKAQGDDDKVFALLEDAVREREDSIPLRTRLAQVYLDARVADKALEHLDKLGDLQLDAGRIDDARATIQAIIALGPDNVVDYQVLLKQLN